MKETEKIIPLLTLSHLNHTNHPRSPWHHFAILPISFLVVITTQQQQPRSDRNRIHGAHSHRTHINEVEAIAARIDG